MSSGMSGQRRAVEQTGCTHSIHTHEQWHRKLLIRFDTVSSKKKNAEDCCAKSHKGGEKIKTDKQVPLVYCNRMMRLCKSSLTLLCCMCVHARLCVGVYVCVVGALCCI